MHKTEHVVLLRLNKEQEALYKKYLEVSCMCPTGRRALRKARCAAPEEGAGGALHRTPQSVLHVARVKACMALEYNIQRCLHLPYS